MKLVATLTTPTPLETRAQELAAETGGTLAECRLRLVGEPPVPFARLEDAAADALAARLRAKGWSVGTCPLPTPSDASRLVARTIEFLPGEVRFTPRTGEPLTIRDAELAVLLRGLRLAKESTNAVVKERKFSMSNAVLTQGLKMTKVEKREVKSSVETTEHFLLAYDLTGRCVAIYDSQVAFGALGPHLQSTKLGNMQFITQELQRRSPQARYDDRLLRLGKRPLPFIASGERSTGGLTSTQTHVDTSGSIDVIAYLLANASG